MRIKKVSIQNFRCFQEFSFECDAPYVIITGANGTGKSSLLEALHYACYLRSFRTHTPRDLIASGQKMCSIDVSIEHEHIEHTVHVGFSHEKKRIKIDQKVVQTYQGLIDYYRVVTITDDDLLFIKGSPETRRTFLDQSIALLDPEYVDCIRSFKKVLIQRNALLSQPYIDKELYRLWTIQLWQYAVPLWKKREDFIAMLQQRLDVLVKTYIDSDLSITLTYLPKRSGAQSAEEVLENTHLFRQESLHRRSYIGIHLDDVLCTFHGKTSRTYASRGQQKLIILLLKIAFLEKLSEDRGLAALLLDDFLTDFDEQKIELLLTLLTGTSYQLLITTPVTYTPILTYLVGQGGLRVSLP